MVAYRYAKINVNDNLLYHAVSQVLLRLVYFLQYIYKGKGKNMSVLHQSIRISKIIALLLRKLTTVYTLLLE